MRKRFSCMRMKLCSDHMRRKVWLYVLHRTEEQMSKQGNSAGLVSAQNWQRRIPAGLQARIRGLFLLFFRRYFFHAGQDGKCGTEFLVIGECIFLFYRFILEQRDPRSAVDI